ncbi:hypothetical protein Tco_0010677 [Tanacetum coccineum]
MVKESLEDVVLAKESSQPQSSYEVAAMLTEFEIKKSYDLDKTIFSTYGKVYSLKRSRKDKDKDEDPSAGSDRGKYVQSEEPEFEVADSDMPQDQEENLGNDDEEPKEKTPQQGQNQSWLMTFASSADKPSKTFDELMITCVYPFIAASLTFQQFSNIFSATKQHLDTYNPTKLAFQPSLKPFLTLPSSLGSIFGSSFKVSGDLVKVVVRSIRLLQHPSVQHVLFFLEMALGFTHVDEEVVAIVFIITKYHNVGVREDSLRS